MQNWWKDRKIIRQVADWAYELQKDHPRNRILSLGQSPAWVVQSVGMLRKLRGLPANITFIPFTGAFVQRGKNSEAGEMTFVDRAEARPDVERITRYFNLLGMLNAQPLQLAAANERVVLAEMIRQGNGLASFLDTWRTFETDEDMPTIMEHVEIYAYDTNPTSNSDRMKTPLHDHVFNLTRVPVKGRAAELMEGITPHNRAEKESSRLVPMYRLSAKAEEKGIELIPNRENRIAIRAALHTEIQHREQHSRRLSMK
jgi:hypothetical protein